MQPDPVSGHPTPGMHIWGWMSPAELEWLGAQAAQMDSVAEIGVLHGRSAFALLTACPGPVYCIDPWNDEGGHSLPSFMGSCGHFENLHAVQGYSPAAAAEAPDVDMVFIDGAHAYGAVLADIAAWLPKTRRLICGHDYQNADAGYPGVAQAVQQVFGDRIVVPEDTSIWTVDLAADRSIAADLPRELTFTDEYERTSTIVLEWPT